MALVAVPPDPDMWVHLCPGFEPGAVDALGAGFAALAGAVLDDSAVDEVDDACAAPDVEPVEALAVVSPYARVAPSTAAPAAVPRRGFEILTRSPFCVEHPANRLLGTLRSGARPQAPGRIGLIRRSPVGQPHLTKHCADLLSPR
jgi:hypothetical protein